MKKQFILIITVFAVLSGGLMAQDDSSDEKRSKRKRTQDIFTFELGLNNYINQDGQFPDSNNELFTLRPAGSWYAALGKSYLVNLAGPLYVDWGGSVSWYNFSFQNNQVTVGADDMGVFFNEVDEVEKMISKSKLTVPYVNAHFVPVLQFGRRGKEVRMGAGIYAGYRLGSYNKTKFEQNGNVLKVRDRDDFYLNNFRYGAKVRFGYKDFDLFAQYDMNSLFYTGRGPELNAISAGIIFSDF